MGFSMELVKARRRIKELEAKLVKIQAELVDRIALAPPFEVTEGVVLSTTEVRNVFISQLQRVGIDPNKFSFELLDTSFFIPSLEDSRRILAWCQADAKRWISQRTDCDNFGFYVAAMSGMIFGVNPFFPFWDFEGRHLYNFVLKPELIVSVLEPQTDEIWNLGERRQGAWVMNSGRIYGF